MFKFTIFVFIYGCTRPTACPPARSSRLPAQMTDNTITPASQRKWRDRQSGRDSVLGLEGRNGGRRQGWKRHSPKTPNLKFIVTTIMFPCAANIEPSYGLPEFHSNDSPWMYTIVANDLLLPALRGSSSANFMNNINIFCIPFYDVAFATERPETNRNPNFASRCENLIYGVLFLSSFFISSMFGANPVLAKKYMPEPDARKLEFMNMSAHFTKILCIILTRAEWNVLISCSINNIIISLSPPTHTHPLSSFLRWIHFTVHP